jgi:MFS family permease
LAEANKIFGPIIAVSGLIATLLGGWAGDRLRDRFKGAYFTVSGLGMLAAFPLFLCVLWLPFPAAWAFIFLACFGLFFNTGPTNTILANVTHPSIRASAFALNILVIHALGDVISPLAIGAIADGYNHATQSEGGLRVGFLVVSFMILLGGLFWLWGARYLERDTILAPTRLEPAANL